jgi:hypothetical protein
MIFTQVDITSQVSSRMSAVAEGEDYAPTGRASGDELAELEIERRESGAE